MKCRGVSIPSNAFRGLSIFTMTDNYKKKIDYQFVPGPINLMWALDNDCWKAICILIDKENYWKSRSKVFNGYFTLSVEELAEHLRLKNKKDARLTLEALYRAGIIDVKAENGKRLGAKIKINWDKITNEEIDWVEKLPRDAKITYCEDADCAETSTNCTPTLEIEKNRTDIEKETDTDTEIDTNIEIDTEPTAEETSISLSFEDYLECFIESYPYVNYSYSPEKFYDTYFQELTGLQTQVREGIGRTLTIRDLSTYLHFFKTTGKVLE